MRRFTRLSMVVALVALGLGDGSILAGTTAHFTIYEVDNLCNVKDDYDSWPTAAPDLRYRVAILDSVDDTFYDYCDGPDNECGAWNFADYTLVKSIPAGQSVWFYFVLIDEDDLDASDIIGNHWLHPYTSMSTSTWAWNNDGASPDYSPVCGDNNEGSGLANDYRLRYRIWYQDDTGPTSMPTPDAVDDALTNPTWDNDTRLDVNWAAALDADTGIDAYHFELRDQTSGSTLFSAATAPLDRSMTLCPSGCDVAFTPVNGHQYRVRIRATNGDYPEITNAGTLWSGYRYIWVDLVDPVSSVSAPAAGAWQGADFGVQVADSDSDSGLDAGACRWRVTSNATTTLNWASRACNGQQTVSVGAAGLCRHQGANTCTVYADSDDQARRASNTASRSFSIDWSADPIVDLTARTDAAGSPIAAATWTPDRDPHFTFAVDPAARYAPIAGYSWDLDSDPDCSPELGGGDAQTLQLPDGTLADGGHSFRVRAVDQAGNCGPVAAFEIWVDGTPDAIAQVQAFTEAAGAPIQAATWQTDVDPYLSWTVPASTSPIVGYSWALDQVPDCTVDGANPETNLSGLTDGQHDFGVRTVDQAGNCGPVTSFALWVLTGAPTLQITSVVPDPARAGVVLILQASSDRDLASDPTATVAGRSASLTASVGRDYTFEYPVVGDELSTADPAGAPAAIQVAGVDLAGNAGAAAGQVTLDFNSPPLDGPLAVTPAVATTGDDLSIAFNSLETLQASPDPEIVVAGQPGGSLVDHSGLGYTFSYTVSGDEGEGPVQVQALLTDLAGNTQAHQASFDLDLTPPEVALEAPTGLVDVDQQVEIRWATTDAHPDRVSIYLSSDGGQTWPVQLADGEPDTGSFMWTVPGSASDQARLRVVATDAVGLVGQAESAGDLTIREPVADHVVASAAGDPVPVGGSATVALQVVDADGLAVAGEFNIAVSVNGAAVLEATSLGGASPGGASVEGLTGSDGAATVQVTDSLAELVQVSPGSADLPAAVAHVPAELRFMAGAADHLALYVTDGQAEAGGVELITVMVLDSLGNPVEQEVTAWLEVDGQAYFADATMQNAVGIGTPSLVGRLFPDGTATLEVSDAVSETVRVTAQGEGLPNSQPDLSAEVTFTQVSAIDPDQVEVRADPDRVLADGVAVSHILVSPRDAAGELLAPGLTVNLWTDLGELTPVEDLGDGTYTADLSSTTCPADPAHLDVQVEDVLLLDAAQVAFTCEAVASASLVADPTAIWADGERCSALRLSLFDDGGQAMAAGQAVRFTASYGQVSEAFEEAAGEYAAELCSQVCDADPVAVSALVNGQDLSALDQPVVAEVVVHCLGVDPAGSTLSVAPTELPADGKSQAVATVTPLGFDGQPLGAGLVVEVSTSLGLASAVADEGDGTYTATLRSEEAGQATVSARVGGVDLDASVQVTFAPHGSAGGCNCGQGSAQAIGLLLLLALLGLLRAGLRRRRAS